MRQDSSKLQDSSVSNRAWSVMDLAYEQVNADVGKIDKVPRQNAAF
jgi:hypothetical protein